MILKQVPATTFGGSEGKYLRRLAAAESKYLDLGGICRLAFKNEPSTTYHLGATYISFFAGVLNRYHRENVHPNS